MKHRRGRPGRNYSIGGWGEFCTPPPTAAETLLAVPELVDVDIVEVTEPKIPSPTAAEERLLALLSLVDVDIVEVTEPKIPPDFDKNAYLATAIGAMRAEGEPVSFTWTVKNTLSDFLGDNGLLDNDDRLLVHDLFAAAVEAGFISLVTGTNERGKPRRDLMIPGPIAFVWPPAEQTVDGSISAPEEVELPRT